MDNNPYTSSSDSNQDNDSFEEFYNSITEALESRERGKISVEQESFAWVNNEGEVISIADFLESDR
ncbi:hypothetical protein NIES2119_19465 [[Phormidium ambiguum] IAM M-71]|uniref:Uncharacterized protein n=1 Tax=[Phormidium ambiguum] IAM M-71 TaxID=454136 RepID=A0A1U7IF82_9CYAN|nr:hypothetical protein [Phormidium ambiguum]OKH35681.1 hypothetical protein NIES2119_19465 [Phormidium ambiguum IAM M-71]